MAWIAVIGTVATGVIAHYQNKKNNKIENRTQTTTHTPNIVHPLDFLDDGWRAQQAQQGRVPQPQQQAQQGTLPPPRTQQGSLNSVSPPSTPTTQYYTDLMAHILRLKKQNEAQQGSMMTDQNGINAMLASMIRGGGNAQ